MISVGPKANTPIDNMKLWRHWRCSERVHHKGTKTIWQIIPEKPCIGLLSAWNFIAKEILKPQNVPERRARLKTDPQLYKYSSFCHSVVIRLTHNHLERCHSRHSPNRGLPGLIERSLAVYSVSMGPFRVPEKCGPKLRKISARYRFPNGRWTFPGVRLEQCQRAFFF